MKIRKAKIKLVTERCSNTREMRRNTLTQSQAHPHSGRSNDGAPPSESMAMVSPHNTVQQRYSQATTQPRLIRHKALLFSFLGGRGSASEDQTYRWPPVTHHHYISAQYHHIPEVTLSRGNERRTGKEGRRDVTVCNMFTARETWTPVLSQVLGSTTHLKGGILQWQ